MCLRLIERVPEVAMYKDLGRDQYLDYNWKMDRDHIEARLGISDTDWKEIEVLNWLHSTT